MVYAIYMIKLLLFLFLVIAPFLCFVYFTVSFIINMYCFPMQKSSIHAQFYLYHTLTHCCDSQSPYCFWCQGWSCNKFAMVAEDFSFLFFFTLHFYIPSFPHWKRVEGVPWIHLVFSSVEGSFVCTAFSRKDFFANQPDQLLRTRHLVPCVNWKRMRSTLLIWCMFFVVLFSLWRSHRLALICAVVVLTTLTVMGLVFRCEA